MRLMDYRDRKIKILATLINLTGGVVFFYIRRKKIDPLKIKKIAIVKLDRIGDTFLATPAIEAVRRIFPNAHITALVAPWNKDVLQNNPNIDTLKIFEGALDVHNASFFSFLNHLKTSKLIGAIREINPDLGIDLEGHPMNVLGMFWAGIPIRFGFGDKILSFLLTNKIVKNKSTHQLDVYFNIAEAFGFLGPKPAEKIFVGSEERREVNEFIKKNSLGDFVVVHLGAGRSYRQWPLQNFISLSRLIVGEYHNLKIVVTGGIEDQELAKGFSEALENAGCVLNAIAALNIPEVYYLLSSAKLFIGSESAPMHFAGANNIPTIAFMNTWSGIDRWKPLGDRVYIFPSKNIHQCPGVHCQLVPCPNMAAISVKEVYNFIREEHLL